MEKSEIEAKRTALSAALSKTCDIIDLFDDVVRRNVSPEHPKYDFNATAAKILPFEDENDTADERLYMNLEQLKQCAGQCTRCKLCETRKNVVFGEGVDYMPVVMVIGEGPGETEDNTGRPFVGKAGMLLDKMLAAISLSRETNTYIANVVKCRPPMNRDPESDEKSACRVFLEQQISLIKPKAILCLGKPASTLMTGQENASMDSLRGHFFYYDSSIPLLCTYHPSAVLRNADLKRPVWEDLKKLGSFLGLR